MSGPSNANRDFVEIRSSFSRMETVPDPTHAQKVLRRARIGLDLLPDIQNVCINHSVDHVRAAPHRLDQLLARKNPAAPTDQGLQQAELERGGFHRLLAAADLGSVEIDLAVTEPAYAACVILETAQDGLDA